MLAAWQECVDCGQSYAFKALTLGEDLPKIGREFDRAREDDRATWGKT